MKTFKEFLTESKSAKPIDKLHKNKTQNHSVFVLDKKNKMKYLTYFNDKVTIRDSFAKLVKVYSGTEQEIIANLTKDGYKYDENI